MGLFGRKDTSAPRKSLWQKITVEIIGLLVAFAFAQVEFATLEGFHCFRWVEKRVSLWCRDAAELSQKLRSPAPNQSG